jgi:hypothetical protein
MISRTENYIRKKYYFYTKRNTFVRRMEVFSVKPENIIIKDDLLKKGYFHDC